MGQKFERKLFQRFERKLLSQVGVLTGVSVLLPTAGPANAGPILISETLQFSIGGTAVAQSPGNATLPASVTRSATTTLAFDKFNSLNSTSSGTLTEIDISLSSTLLGVVSFPGTHLNTSATATWSDSVHVIGPGFNFSPAAQSFSLDCGPDLCNATSSMTFAENHSAIFTGSEMNPYLGTGEVFFNVASVMTASVNGFGQAAFLNILDPPAPDGLTVTYVITPTATVPEPATLGLLGIGALAGLGFARKRTKQDG